MSDHTQSIPRVGGGASGTPQQGAAPSSGYAPKSSSPSTSAIPSNGGAASNARTTAGAAARAGNANRPWSPPPARTPAVPPQTSAVPPTTGVRQGSGMPPASRASQDMIASTGSKKARAAQKAARGPRKARLQLRHIDTWSAMKISLVLSIVMFFVWMVAVGILYGVLSGLNVFDAINETVGSLGGEEGTATDLITPGLVFGGAALIGAINIVLFTALATIATYIYNLSADLVGGLEVTLTERE